MLDFLFTIFIRYGALVPVCILISSFALKHATPAFPNKLIPIINITVSIFCLVFWSPLIKAHWPLSLRIFNGLLYGFAATGIHQTFKQLRSFIRLNKYKKKLRKERDLNARNTSN